MTDGPAVDTRPTKIMYVAEATAHGGREGYVTSQDGQIGLKVAMPPQLGGDGNGTNPEQLFAAGYSSCFHNALILVGNREGYDLAGSTVAAKVGIGPNAQHGYGLAVALSVSSRSSTPTSRPSWWTRPTRSARTRTRPAGTST